MTDKTLREALALSREYVASASERSYDGTNGRGIRDEAKRRLALVDAALASSPEQAEPVAWRDPSNLNTGQSVTFDKATAEKWPHIYSQALFDKPQPAAPVGQTLLESPWSVHDGGRYLAYEDDEPDDLIVRLDANWESDDQRLTFAEAIRNKLNATAPTAPAPAGSVRTINLDQITPEMEKAFQAAFINQIHNRKHNQGRKPQVSAEIAGLRAMLAAAPSPVGQMVSVSEEGGEGQENECPTCGAEPGQMCSDEEGREHGRKVHPERQDVVRKRIFVWKCINEPTKECPCLASHCF